MSLPREQRAAIVNRSMPPGVIIPELAYPNVRAAADWLCHAFGFTERLRIGSHRVQLTLGEGSVVVVEPRGAPGVAAPSIGDGILVHVADVDAVYERARKHGAWTGGPPVDHPYGERQFNAEDLGGHRWTFSQSIADVTPSEWGGELVE